VSTRSDSSDTELASALATFAELFDAGRYHDAHEVLDAAWMATEGPDADFLKGLIQASICLHHFERDNLEGARKLYSGHRRLLAGYLPAHHGIDVEAFLAAMQACLRPVVRARPGTTARFDADARPRIPRIPDGA